MSSGGLRAVPRAGDDAWQPVLLRMPVAARRAAQWFPVLLRRRRITTLGLLTFFLALQFLIPARLVISGMGAAGRPSAAVGAGLAFLWALSAARPRQQPPQRQPIRLIVGIFVASQLLGYAIGFDRLPSAMEASSANRWLIFVVSIAGVTLAVADGLRTRAELDRLLKALVLLAAIMSAVGILQFLRIVDLVQHVRIPGLQQNADLLGVSARGATDLARVAGTANHYIEYGVVLALVLPVALHYAFFATSRRSRSRQWLLVAVVAAGIPLSISRSAILAAAVTMALSAMVWPWRLRYNALVVGLMSVVIFRVINPGVLGTIRSLFTNALNDSSVTDRIDRTTYVMDLWATRPWLGRGAGMVIPEQYILLDNQWYVTLLAGGVVGVGVLLLFFLVPYGLARSIRLRGQDQETRHLGNALAATMPAAVLSAATFDAFSFTTWVGVIAVFIGAVGALWRLDGTSVSRGLQMGDPGDRYVTAPLTAHVGSRVRAARRDTDPQGEKLSRSCIGAGLANEEDGRLVVVRSGTEIVNGGRRGTNDA